MSTSEIRGLSLITSTCYNMFLEQKPLIETNPYLRDPVKFRKALITSVASSTAIETGAPVASIARMLEEGEKTVPSRRRKAPLDNLRK